MLWHCWAAACDDALDDHGYRTPQPRLGPESGHCKGSVHCLLSASATAESTGGKQKHPYETYLRSGLVSRLSV